VPMPLVAAIAGSWPTGGTGLPGGRMRGPLAAPASGIVARSADAARAVVSAAVAADGTGGTGGDLIASLASVEVGEGSGVSMMISGAGGAGAAMTLDAGADAALACSTTAGSRRPENCQAASAATTTNNPPPARTSHDLPAPRRPLLDAAWGPARAAGRDAGDGPVGGRLSGPEPPTGSVAGRDAAHDAGCEGGPSRCCSDAGCEAGPWRCSSEAGCEGAPSRRSCEAG